MVFGTKENPNFDCSKLGFSFVCNNTITNYYFLATGIDNVACSQANSIE